MSKYSLEITVFLAGAALMILELTGSRLLAPYIGTSIIVWTSLIGVIMGALSLGYYVGGKIADREAKSEKLALVILTGAFFVLAIIFASPEILKLTRALANIYFGAIFSTVILFSLPGFFLGIVSPYAVKLRIKDLDFTGRTVGDLYAISTIGSIAGTFAAGFWLIPFLGTIRILYFTAATLVLASLFAAPKKFFKARLLLILILLAVIFFSSAKSGRADAAGLIDVDSRYSRLLIYPAVDAATNRPVLRLANDPFGVQSAMFTDRDDDLVFKYSKYYRLSDVVNPRIQNALMIGGAAYSYPKDFLARHGGAKMDVVEIDPKMTELAKKYFNLKDDPRLAIYHEDARVFLNNNQKKYDAIYVDAFNSHLSVPYQLTTREAVRKIYSGLNNGGVAMVNIISAIEGDKGKFLRAEYATYKSVFPQIYLFRVDNVNPDQVQNLILMAMKSDSLANLRGDNAEFNGMLNNIWRAPIKEDLPVLTDDFAPVDYYILNLL